MSPLYTQGERPIIFSHAHSYTHTKNRPHSVVGCAKTTTATARATIHRVQQLANMASGVFIYAIVAVVIAFVVAPAAFFYGFYLVDFCAGKTCYTLVTVSFLAPIRARCPPFVFHTHAHTFTQSTAVYTPPISENNYYDYKMIAFFC